MTTAQNWIDEVKRHLLGAHPETIDILNVTIVAGATTLVYTDGIGGIVAGATIEIDTELMYVRSVNTGTKTATVIRGFMGTTAAGHASGAMITVAPKFPQHSILTALNHELYDVCSPQHGLFRIGNVDITTAAGVVGYNFNAPGYLALHEVHYEATASAKHWALLPNVRVIEQADSTDFTSGRGLIVADAHGLDGGTLHVSYKRNFSQLTAVTDDVATVTGMPTEMHDIPPLGAMVRLTATRGVRRAFDDFQGEPRRASEVSEQAMAQNANVLLTMRNRRIAAEAARLNQLYPRRIQAGML